MSAGTVLRTAVRAARTPRTDSGDAALMARVQAGDDRAFGVLYDRFERQAFSTALAISRDRARAEEVVQEAFLSVWRSRADFRPEAGSVGGWIMWTVRHRAIDTLRRHGRHDRRRADDDLIESTVPTGEDTERHIGERDEAARLRTQLAALPAAQREVIALAYFGELSVSEIAKELDLPLGTVKGRVRLGLEKLRDGPALDADRG